MNNEATPSLRTSFHLLIDGLARGVVRVVDRLTAPKYEPMFIDWVTQVLPFASGIIDAFKPAPSPAEGPAIRQVQRELAAEEARLHAEHAARLATLIADFGPKLLAATAADEEGSALAAKHFTAI